MPTSALLFVIDSLGPHPILVSCKYRHDFDRLDGF